jgi:hypothetical protein
MTLEQVLTVANQLSPIDKLNLVKQLMGTIEPTAMVYDRPEVIGGEVQPRISSWGALAVLGTAPSAAAIDEVRQEMWAGFGERDV